LDYKAISDDARHEAAREHDELERGTDVVWSLSHMGRTTGFSPAHRVGESFGGEQMTTCGEVIPPPALRVPLTPNLARAFRRCTHCEALHAKQQLGRWAIAS